jgi:hypothetical protein
MYHWVWPRINRIRPPRHTYQKIEKELKSKPDWPKLGGKDISEGTHLKERIINVTFVIPNRLKILRIIHIQISNGNLHNLPVLL